MKESAYCLGFLPSQTTPSNSLLLRIDSFGTAVPLAGDGRYAAEVDGLAVASIRFGASRPTRPEESS